MARVITSLPPELTAIIFLAGSRKIVLVEGDSDQAIFDLWYLERASEIYFHASGGTDNVQDFLPIALAISALKHVYGIIDRDYRDDADALAWRTENDPHLFILPRHELENYLLEPEQLREEIQTITLGSPSPSVSDIETALLQMCRDLIPIIAANWLYAEAGSRAVHFGESVPDLDRVILRKAVASGLLCSVTDAENRMAAKEATLVPLLTSLAQAHTRIKGKILFHRIHHKYVAHSGVSKEVFRNYMARAMLASGVPADIREIVETHILSAS